MDGLFKNAAFSEVSSLVACPLSFRLSFHVSTPGVASDFWGAGVSDNKNAAASVLRAAFLMVFIIFLNIELNWLKLEYEYY